MRRNRLKFALVQIGQRKERRPVRRLRFRLCLIGRRAFDLRRHCAEAYEPPFAIDCNRPHCRDSQGRIRHGDALVIANGHHATWAGSMPELKRRGTARAQPLSNRAVAPVAAESEIVAVGRESPRSVGRNVCIPEGPRNLAGTLGQHFRRFLERHVAR